MNTSAKAKAIDRGIHVVQTLETLTQEYFDKICEKLYYGDKRISKADLFVIRATVGPITFDQFSHYIDSMGEYTLDESDPE